MSFSQYKEEFDNAPDPNAITPEGIYSFKVKAASAGKDRQGRDRVRWDLKITGPGMIGRVIYINRYPDSPGGVPGIKADLTVFGGGKPILDISDLDDPRKLDRIVDLQVEGSIKHAPNPRDPEKPYVNAYLRRLIDAPFPVDPLRFPPANGANGNGAGHAADPLEVDASAEGVPF